MRVTRHSPDSKGELQTLEGLAPKMVLAWREYLSLPHEDKGLAVMGGGANFYVLSRKGTLGKDSVRSRDEWTTLITPWDPLLSDSDKTVKHDPFSLRRNNKRIPLRRDVFRL